MSKYILTVLFVCVPHFVFCSQNDQVIWYTGESGDGEPVLYEKIVPNKDSVSGSYHFGFSETESEIIITENAEGYDLKHKTGEFSKDGNRFVWQYTVLERFTTSGGRFEKDGWSGRFVYYYYQPVTKSYSHGKATERVVHPVHKVKGLIIQESPVQIQNELGIACPTFTDCRVAGDYPESHYRLLTVKDTEDKSGLELKRMRNEIFARYGYIFREGGKMDSHFKRQKWYTPRFRRVMKFMNNYEKKNIEFISSHE